MAFIPVPNTILLETVFEYDNQVVENTSYWEINTPPVTPIQIVELMTAIRVFITSDLMPLLTSSIQLVRLVGTLLDAVDSVSHVMVVNPPVAGGVGGEPLPNNVTYAVQFLTQQRGRSFRGRNFIPGIPNDGVDGNLIDGTFRSNILAYYFDLAAVGAGEGWQHVVVSKMSNGVPRVTGVTTPVSGYGTADLFVDSMRRRLPGRGT